MKNLIYTKQETVEHNIAKVVSIAIYALALILIKIIAGTIKIAYRFKRPILKLALFVFVITGFMSYFMPNAVAPRVDASKPYEEHFSVDLPMKVTPDLKLRDTVLSLVRIEFGEDQVYSFDQIVIHESGWDPKAVNPHGGACGLFQALPCNKMKSTNIEDQIAFGISYIRARYETPNKAWEFWKLNHWY